MTGLAEVRVTPGDGEFSEPISPLRECLQGMTGAEPFSKLFRHNGLQAARLEEYAVRRTHALMDSEGKVRAEATIAGHLKERSLRPLSKEDPGPSATSYLSGCWRAG
jgi:hypothetical protein